MEYKNATVRHKANVYHDGKVTSRTVIMSDGETKTLGIMLPGAYRFGTDAPERMELTQGQCRVKLADESQWTDYEAGQSFHVPGQSSFEIEVVELLDYICHFEKA